MYRPIVNISIYLFLSICLFPLMESYKPCSDRTKRRRIAAEVAKHLSQLDTVPNELAADNNCVFVGHLNTEILYSHEQDCDTDVSSLVDEQYLSESDISTDNDDGTIINDSTNITADFISLSENSDEDNLAENTEWIARPIYQDSDSDGDVDDTDNVSLREQLVNWKTQHNISLAAMSDLLCILQKTNPELPKDARTLLQTQRTIATRTLAGGDYYYFGVKYWLAIILNSSESNVSELHLHVNIDGIPLFNSSNTSLWPILGYVKEIGRKPFPIAIYCSSSKPNCLDAYLSDFISEMKDLESTGFIFCGRLYTVRLGVVICDAPARAFVKCIKPHTAYNSCERCSQRGEWCDKIILPDLSASKRTDETFRSALDADHHVGVSPFTQLSCGLVSDFPLDYMHLVCLGVVRRLLHLWIHGPRCTRMSHNQLASISSLLQAMHPHIPCDFSRKPRSLFEYKHWKATELRLFLLYTGPVSLKGLLPPDLYANFLDLSVAVRLLLCHSSCIRYADFAENLLKYFVSCFCKLYGKNQLVYNVHSLIHLADDAKQHGALDHVSSFPFESYLGRLKKLVHRPKQPCIQIVRRIFEGHCQPTNAVVDNCQVHFKKPHMEGPLPLPYVHCLQYKIYQDSKLSLSTIQGDNCCEIEGKVGIIKNILQDPSKNAYVVFEEFESISPFFTEPLDSALLTIFSVEKLSGIRRVIALPTAVTKCMMLPFRDRFVVLSQIHCE